jgi:hypothetical protein
VGFLADLAKRRGARVKAFDAYRRTCDPKGVFKNIFRGSAAFDLVAFKTEIRIPAPQVFSHDISRLQILGPLLHPPLASPADSQWHGSPLR